jgi:hypothetical protein
MPQFLLMFFILSGLKTANAQNDFRQAANNNGDGLGVVSWINGIVQQNNSRYYEGMSVPQRVIFLNLTGTNHTLTLSHQSIKASENAHAYDFITSWPQAVVAAGVYTPSVNLLNTMNDCGPGGQSNFLNACAAVHSGAQYHIDIPVPSTLTPTLGDDINARSAAYSAHFGARFVRIWGDAPFTGGNLSFTGYTGNDYDANYDLSWTSASASVVVEFATHIAIGSEPYFPGTGYGAGKGAASINGGPYHVSLAQIDGASTGSQDNQLMAGAVLQIAAPVCNVNGPLVTCASTNSVQFTGSVDNAGTNTTYQFSLGSNTANALISGSSSGSYTGPVNLTVVPGAGGFTPGGSVTVNFIISMNGIVVTQCSATITINPLPVAFGQGLSACDGGDGTAIFDLTTLIPAINGGTGNPVTFYTASNLDPVTLIPNPGAYVSGTNTMVYARVVNVATGCVNVAPVTLTVSPKPDCSINGASSACAGTAGLVFTSSAGGQSYVWVVTGGTIISGQGTDQITVNAGAAGTMNVQLTLTGNNGCVNTCNVNVAVNELPSISGNLSVCKGLTTQLTGTPNPASVNPWISSNPAVATVSATGLVTCISAGTTIITYTNSNGCTATAVVTVTICIPVCTYTQGAYGNAGGSHCNAGNGTSGTSLAFIQNALSAGAYTFGSFANNRYFILTPADAVHVQNEMLPGGGNSQVFGAGGAQWSLGNTWSRVPLKAGGAGNGKILNTLFAQTLTLWISIRNSNTLGATILKDTLVTKGTTACRGGVPAGASDTIVLPHNVIVYLNGGNGYSNNVSGLFKLANDVLGGVNTNFTPDAIGNMVDQINNAFDECRFLISSSFSAGTGKGFPTTNFSSVKNESPALSVPNVRVTASPNPYKDEVTFTIYSDISGFSSFEIYGIRGEKVAVLFQGNLEKNVTKSLRYSPGANKNTLIYKFRIGDDVYTGKVIHFD